ncbi:ADP-ribosyl cyclase/cyclic ADP-ribose hydrolase 1-like [Brachionichthys hirsutus]|uniref:ADP-ribosyl cyclase/cyclic ADP-ribose hydrolase 1-like n=1 Tax=Brachionichthys hirsutus TaxID=412623 RepID=UPI003604952E
MDNGAHGPPDKRRRRRCFILSLMCVLLLLLIIIVAVVSGLTLRHDAGHFKQTFTSRCESFKGYDCQKVWEAFEQAYVGKDPCRVPMEAYEPFVAAAPLVPACNRLMFWSGTKDVVHDFTGAGDCFITAEHTLMGFVLDGLTWCGKEGSAETFTTGCPGWTDCQNNTVRSFWNRASAAFADVACGDVTVMLNGSFAAPFSAQSVFGSIEVQRLNSTRVRSLRVALVTRENFVANCSNASLKDLQKELDKGIKYSCEEVAEAQLQECRSNPGRPCGACW